MTLIVSLFGQKWQQYNTATRSDCLVNVNKVWLQVLSFTENMSFYRQTKLILKYQTTGTIRYTYVPTVQFKQTTAIIIHFHIPNIRISGFIHNASYRYIIKNDSFMAGDIGTSLNTASKTLKPIMRK